MHTIVSRRMLLALAASVVSSSAWAYPDKQIQVVVPWPAGGVVDTVARMASARLASALGQAVVVVNRPGAGGTIGSDLVAKSSANGYTFLVTSSGMSMNHALRKDTLPFDMTRDLAPVGVISSATQVIVVNATAPVTDIKSLVQAAKSSPGKLNYASAGNGSPAHMGSELLKSATGTFITHIPFQGAPAALTSTVSGDTLFFMAPIPTALPLIKAGRLRVVATTGPTRSASLPDAPTVAESGLPGFEATQWIGMFAPRQTPQDMVTRVANELVRITKDPAFRSELAARGLEIQEADAKAFGQMVSSDLSRWEELVRNTGIKVD